MEQVNSLKQNKEQSVLGWTFDLEFGLWNQIPANDCADSSWFGWTGTSVGSLKTTLYGSGHASLTFGNCWTEGTVNLYIDGTIIASAGPTSMKTATFDYSNSNELKLDEDIGIIRFEDFKVSIYEGRIALHSLFSFLTVCSMFITKYFGLLVSVKNRYQINDLACTGSENCIFECTPDGWKVEKSNATEWLGVTCKQKQDCQWGEWSSYSGCSVTCGNGNQIRTREKIVEEKYGGLCQDSAHNSKICTLDPCCPGRIFGFGLGIIPN